MNPEDPKPRTIDEARRVNRENVAAAAWIALLVGVGCFVLDALADSAQRDECLLRGGAYCSRMLTIGKSWAAQPHEPTHARPVWIGSYLKNSRSW